MQNIPNPRSTSLLLENTCRACILCLHTDPASPRSMLSSPGTLLAALPIDPYLGRGCVYPGFLYLDTQGKIYTDKGSGKMEFQLTELHEVCFQFLFLLPTSLKSVSLLCCFSKGGESPCLQNENLQEWRPVINLRWIQIRALSIWTPRMDQRKCLVLFISV